MRKLICLAILLALAAPVVAQNAPQGAMKAGARMIMPDGPADAPSDLFSSNLLGDCTGAEFCCAFTDPTCAGVPGTYNGGDTVCFSDYWTDTVDVDQNWSSDWTHAYLVGANIIPIFLNEPIDFGFVPAGTYTFCVGYSITLPSPPVSTSVDTGFRAVSPTGTGGPQVTNSFTLNP